MVDHGRRRTGRRPVRETRSGGDCGANRGPKRARPPRIGPARLAAGRSHGRRRFDARLFGPWRLHRVKFRDVRSGWQLDTQRVSGALSGIVEPQPFAHFAGLHAHGRVVARIVAGRPPKNFDANGALFEDIGGAAQRVLHHEPQKILAPLAGTELMAGQDASHLLAHLFFRGPRATPPIRRIGGRLALRHLLNLPLNLLPEFAWSDSNRLALYPICWRTHFGMAACTFSGNPARNRVPKGVGLYFRP